LKLQVWSDPMTSRQSSFNRVRFLAYVAFAVVICVGTSAMAQFSTLYHFGRVANDGIQPQGGLIADKSGNLYGVTSGGGVYGGGTVFELSPPSGSGEPWTESILYNFNTTGGSGFYPEASLAWDASGNLYGTTGYGAGANGTVFQLEAPTSAGGAWTFNVLYTFQGGDDGEVPVSGVIFDSAGNLYGTTFFGGACNNGTVFELSPPAIAGGAWTESVLHTFRFYCDEHTGRDGAGPYGPLVLEGGSLYGTTSGGGGTSGEGIVFKLSPPADGGTGWGEQILYTFTGGSDGAHPFAGLTFHNDNFYGTTAYGGNVSPCSNGIPGCGVVFEVSPPAAPGGGWTETPIYSFVNGSDGSLPFATVIFDHSGNLYGTTSVGGPGACDYISDSGCGAVFELTPPVAGGGEWPETTLHSFTGNSTTDQGANVSGLTFGRGGKLYGTTGENNERDGNGTIFSVVP
jgi:uncharacterized repeat protein (TIGR03803 family)